MHRWLRWSIAGMTAALAACSAGADNSQNTGGAKGNGAAGGAAGAAGSADDGGGLLMDGASNGDDAALECPNVDVLFVIDDSASMTDNQIELINSFPGFVSAIQTQLANTKSYHIGVTTSDQYYSGNPKACQPSGDLVTQTTCKDCSQAVCTPFSSGKNYIDETESDLAGKFACIAKVGSYGEDDEHMMAGMLNAINPANNAAGTCNDGFSRLDSLLVVVLITDEDDWPDLCNDDPPPMTSCGCETCGSGGDPDSWYSSLVSYKGGIDQNIVVLSLIGVNNTSCAPEACAHIMDFTNKFGANGHVGDVCASSYDQFFSDALPVISTACHNYVPPK